MDEYIAHQEEDEATGLILKIVQDPDPTNPRTDYDHAATMCCDHGRYDLGDKDGHDKARAAIRGSSYYKASWEDEADFDHGPNLFGMLLRCFDVTTLPLYLYDHSGITMNTRGFSCPWDSGQVGFIFITQAEVLETFAVTELTQEVRDKAFDLLRGEVTEYDQYLTGYVYGYVIEDQNGEHLESCWGFYGQEYTIEEGQSVFKAMIEQQTKDNALLDKLGIPEVA